MYKTIRSYFSEMCTVRFFHNYGLRFGTTGFGPRSENSTPQVISEYRYRRKSLYTSIVARTVKLYRYNRNIVINVIVVNGVECTQFQFGTSASSYLKLKLTGDWKQYTLTEKCPAAKLQRDKNRLPEFQLFKERQKRDQI